MIKNDSDRTMSANHISYVEEQISIAKRKAGITENEPAELQRFEVIRHV